MIGHSDYDTSQQLIGFPTLVGIHQQTHPGGKTHEYKEYRDSSACPSSLCTCTVTHTIGKGCASNQCGKALSSFTSLQGCEETRMEKESDAYEPCTKGFNYQRHLQTHSTATNEEDLCECNQHDEASRYDSSLQSHQRTPLEIKTFEYNESGKAFACQSLHQVSRCHSREKSYGYQCGRVFTCPSYLQINERANTREKPFECNQLHKALANNNSLQMHEKSHIGEKSYACNQCGEAFAQNSDLQNHERTHIGEKPYVCNQCDKSFVSNTHLQMHEKTHTGGKPYACNHCGKAFTQNSHLQIHERTHAGEGPYEYNQCGKAFTHKSNLQIHERTHTEEKPYECNQCGKSFACASALHQHGRSHSVEKIYECNKCGKAFTYKHNLHYHKRIHTGERPYECNQCGKAFAWGCALQKHERIHWLETQ
ncbi:zinc finger protein 433-like [Acomys russatus]|uniref:zinc finger protein 433-like n=1 Tax=Acomys russatus TaxID=60746 RepID=UPI0021E25536|nr:zinc finger protein 433-like [Acomys russatus]